MAVVQEDLIREVVPGAVVLPFDQYDSFSAVVEAGWGSVPVTASTAIGGITEILPVAQGCLGRCTYCITRLARGPLVSYDPDGLLEHTRNAVSSGCREILLTAQDTAAYGLDRRTDLGRLVGGICSVPGDFRIRVGMMNPDNLGRIIDSYLSSWLDHKVYKFLHLPVQSGSDDLLERMGRGYSVEDFLRMVRRFREAFPDMTLSTDVILGFPGETEEDYLMTRDLVETVRPNILNITRFSPRPGTPAFSSRDRVPGCKVKKWSRDLTGLRFEISGDVYRRLRGRVERVLITEIGKDGAVIGRTDTYWPVVIPEEVPLGNFIEVELIDSAPTHLVGRPV